MDNEKTIFLVTSFEHGEDEETERLVSASKRSKAFAHVAAVNKASAADVARVLGAGGTVEEATE